MTTVVESFCSDEEYNELEEHLDDAEEAGEAVQDGAEAAAQLLAATEPEAAVVTDLEATPVPATGDIMSATSSAIKVARQPQPARLAATRALQFESQHTPSSNEVRRIAAGQTEIPNLEIVTARLQQLHNMNWDDISDLERAELTREQGALLDAMVDTASAVRTRHEGITKAAGLLAEKNDARGELATGLTTIAAAHSSASGIPGPYKPDSANVPSVFDPNAENPSQQDVVNKQMYDAISGFKLINAATAEGPAKVEQQKAIDQMSKFVALTMLKQQKEQEAKKIDEGKQNHWHCSVYKSMTAYDNEKAGAPTIDSFLSNIAYVLQAHVKSSQYKVALIAKLSLKIQEELQHIERDRMEQRQPQWTYNDIATYLTRTYKADLDRESLLKQMGKLQQGDQPYRHFHRQFNNMQRNIANASDGQYESMATQIALFKSKIDPDLLFQINLKWSEDWQLADYQNAAHDLDPACHQKRKAGETSHRALVVNSDRFMLTDAEWEKLGDQGQRGYLAAVRTARQGKGQGRSQLAAIEKAEHDTKISFRSVRGSYSDEEIEKRFASMGKTPPSDPEIRHLYDKDFIVVEGKKQPACIRCKTVGSHMLWQCTKAAKSPKRGEKRKGAGKGKGKGGGKGKRKLSLNAITAGAKNMSAEDKAAAIAALQE